MVLFREGSSQGLLDQLGRGIAIHAVLVFVGGLSWSSVVRSKLVLVDGPVHAFVTVSRPQVWVELHSLPEDELLGAGEFIGEGHAFFGRQSVGFLTHDAWAIPGVDGVDVPGHHDWWHPFAIFAFLVLLLEIFLIEGGTELLDDALPGLGNSVITNVVSGVHAFLQTEHFSEEVVQW